MKIGARAHDFGRHSESELPRIIKDAGFDAVQLAITKAIEGISSFDGVTTRLLENIRRSFAENNVEISVMGCYVEIGSTDKDERLREVDRFLTGLDHAKELGVSLAGTETTNFNPAPEYESGREAAYQGLKDSVLRIVEKAEKVGVQIGIEPVADHTLNSAALTKRLLDEVGSDKLKLIFDPVNLILSDTAKRQEDIYKEFFDAVGDKIAAVHMKDIVFENGEKIWRNIGNGIVNYDVIFEWLHLNKPDISLLREHVKMDSYKTDIEAMLRWRAANRR